VAGVPIVITLNDWDRKRGVKEECFRNILDKAHAITLDTTGAVAFQKGDGENGEVLTIRRVPKEAGRLESGMEVEIETYGFIGRYIFKNYLFDIRYRFGDTVLQRMVARAAGFDGFIPYAPQGEGEKGGDFLVRYILSQLYVLHMEKAAAMGFPQRYERVEYRESTLKGQVDIGRFIRKDLPFIGRISSVRYERKDVQEMLDLMEAAFRVVERNDRNLVNRRVMGIRRYVGERAVPRFIDRHTLETAKGHRLLHNPLYAPFKNAIQTASLLVRNEEFVEGEEKLESLLFDVSLMWEHYIYALLRDAIHEDDELRDRWRIYHEKEITVYDDTFFARKIIPDIVIVNERENRVLVLDAKSKAMACRGYGGENMGDLDRTDFFQLHTYMGYYSGKYERIDGGLIYPREKESCEEETMKAERIGCGSGEFFVDGVVVPNELKIADLCKNIIDKNDGYNEFIENIKKRLKPKNQENALFDEEWVESELRDAFDYIKTKGGIHKTKKYPCKKSPDQQKNANKSEEYKKAERKLKELLHYRTGVMMMIEEKNFVERILAFMKS
jgi:hypothetical protein